MANHPPSHYLDIGQQGEDLVTQWLQSTGWLILHRRFSCRWGEIDIIAQYPGKEVGEQRCKGAEEENSTLAFVEVKTRSSRNWDAGGREAITPQKQAKLWRTAEMFLNQYPENAEYPCRFDVAIVGYQQISKLKTHITSAQDAVFSASIGDYKFFLEEYIPAAFDL
ncbi:MULTISPECIES: YraN family protein [Nostocales]|uniref:YraN family protein n=1 Tax=Nostocales TaxID=1161 RepID=UPI0016881341|nr:MULTISPECIES: YraN family protein [Nostocales]MBD2298197.1 YraN family protein [Nostoc sp. FACHB-190]MBD2489369.1 YraN family protein [Aulosira sp. FACHB-615]